MVLEKMASKNWSQKIHLRQKNARKFERLFYFYHLIHYTHKKDVWCSPHDPTCTKLYNTKGVRRLSHDFLFPSFGFLVEFWVFIEWSHPNIPHAHTIMLDARPMIFSGPILPGTILPETIFPGTIFPGTNFPGTILSGTILPETNFPGIFFQGPFFWGPNFREPIFQGPFFRGPFFRGQFSGNFFPGTSLLGTNFPGIFFQGPFFWGSFCRGPIFREFFFRGPFFRGFFFRDSLILVDKRILKAHLPHNNISLVTCIIIFSCTNITSRKFYWPRHLLMVK